MPSPISRKGELPPVVVPPHLWMRSGRPGPGRVLHYGVPLAFAVIGLTADSTAAKMSLIGAGLLLWVLIPAVTQNALEKIGRTIEGASRRRAGSLLRTLRGRPLVSLFAPYAWVTLQEARLHLKLGDGKAAARAFAETARLCRQPDAVMLVSAQAHALVVAGDRKNARRLLNKLLKAKLVGPRDQLDLAIVLLTTSEKKARQALAYIEAARKTIGDHPRLVAAHAVALLQLEKVDKASEMLERAQIYLQEDPDPVVDDLVRRGRHKHRRVIEAQLRRERRARSRRTTIVVTSETAVNAVVGGIIDGMSDGEKVEAAKDEKAKEARRSLKKRGWADPTEARQQANISIELDGPIHKQSVS
ncbi:MAG: tetratricopeptide repeat protein, partial [Myxococcales bacterium]|nr:tetratricopeptide repeat protein [Myxococcales bacterium]